MTPLATVADCVRILDMRSGYPFAHNVLGFSDPSVALVDGRWTMFLGGMAPTFRTNIYEFELPCGADPTSPAWSPSRSSAASARRVRPIVRQPARGTWNRCMHSVCYVRGMDSGVEVERIYHAGRAVETVLHRRAPYRIGYLERRPGCDWVSAQAPIPLHSAALPSVLEPKVEFHDGLWHMRFLTIPVGLPSDDTDHFRIMHTVSRTGRDDWSEPVEWFGADDGFFDSVVAEDEHGAVMVITRDSDLEGRTGGPVQGVWLSTAAHASAPRSAWSDPVRVFAPEEAGIEWVDNGMCAPSAQWIEGHQRRLSVFFAGAPRDRSWPRLTLRALRARRTPPVPSPVYFTVGRLDIDIPVAGDRGPGLTADS